MEYTYGTKDENAKLLTIKIFGDETTQPIKKMRMLSNDPDSIERSKRVLDNMNARFSNEDGYNSIDKALAKLFITGVIEMRDGDYVQGIQCVEAALDAKGASIEDISQITEFASRFPKIAIEAAGDPLNTNISERMLSKRGKFFQVMWAFDTRLGDKVNVE